MLGKIVFILVLMNIRLCWYYTMHIALCVIVLLV